MFSYVFYTNFPPHSERTKKHINTNTIRPCSHANVQQNACLVKCKYQSSMCICNIYIYIYIDYYTFVYVHYYSIVYHIIHVDMDVFQRHHVLCSNLPSLPNHQKSESKFSDQSIADQSRMIPCAFIGKPDMCSNGGWYNLAFLCCFRNMAIATEV